MAQQSRQSLMGVAMRLYGLFTGKAPVAVTVSTRYTLDGTDNTRLVLDGADSTRLTLDGTDNSRLSLEGI